jgi:hypothetical protein
MEPTQSGNQGFIEGRVYNALTILVATVVSLAVCITIAGQWKTYDWIKKLLAVALLLNLAIGPLVIIMRLRKGLLTAKPDMPVQVAYTSGCCWPSCYSIAKGNIILFCQQEWLNAC